MSLLGKIKVKLGWDNSEFNKGEKDAEKGVSNFGDKIKSMAVKAAAAIGVLTLLQKAFNFGAQAYNTAAQAEGVERAFKRLNNPNLLNQLRDATQGTVSDLELMQNAIQAKNFKIPLENLASYLKFANQRAKETGQSVDYLVQSIVLGVGRKSPLILDNLGISALEVRDEFAKTGDMAKAVANIIDREMGDANDTLETSKTLTEQNTAAWENFEKTAGQSSWIKSLGDAWNSFSTMVANSLTDLFSFTGKNSIEAWVYQNISDPSVSADQALANLKIQLEDSDKKLSQWGVNSQGLNKWVKGFNDLGRGVMKFLTLGFYDPKRTEEFARNAALLAQTAYNDKTLQLQAEASVKQFGLEKKTLEELQALKAKFKGNTSSPRTKAINDALDKEIEQRKELVRLNQTEQGIKEQIAQLEEDRSQLELGSKGYKDIDKEIDLLKKRLESYTKTKKEVEKIGAKGSISFAENELKDLEQKIKFVVTDKERKDLQTQIDSKQLEIKAMLKVEPKTERQAIEDAIKMYEDMQLAIPIGIGIGAPEDIAAAQAEWDRLSAIIKQAKEELEKFPKTPEIELPTGSVAAYEAEIAKLTKGISMLTGEQYDTVAAAKAFQQIMLEGVSVGWKTQLEQEIEKLNQIKTALDSATSAQRTYFEEKLKAQQQVVDGYDKDLVALQDFNDQFAQILETGSEAAVAGLGAAIGELIMSNPQDAWSVLLNPIADMAIQLGELAIATGISIEGIKEAFKSMNPYVAIAAGVALVALGTVVKGAISNMSGGKGASSGQTPNTFTGGYSYGGNNSAPANSEVLKIRAQEPQVIVLDTRVSGSDIIFAADKERMRRGK